MQKEIRHSWHFSAPPQEVWEYLTKPELLEQWMMKIDFVPKVGHKFSFLCKSTKITSCEVLEVKPVTRLSYSWQTNSDSDHSLIDSKVVWTLVPKEDGTELQLVHNGFTAIEDVIGHNDGWTTLGSRLVELLNTVEK